MNSSNPNKFTIADVLANFGKKQAQVQQEKSLKDQLKQALMQNQAQELGQFVPGMQQQMPPQEEMSMEQAYQQAKRGGIHLDPSKKGTFKAQATRMGMGIQEAAAHILANKNDYSPAMRRKANFARNFAKEEGGETLEPCPPGYVFYQGECVPWTEPNYDQVSNNGGYNPLTQTISSNPNIPRHSDIDWMQHEKYHHLQNIAGDMSSSGLLGMRPNPYVASDMSIAGYYDRRDNELNREIDNMIAKNNMLQFIPREKLRYGSAPGFIGADSLMYGRPGTVEGDARIYEKQVVQDPNVIQEAMYRKGGEMIKRADGSYSQRGLWDNIRANKGSGRKPTREMIEQERKLRRKAMGGMMGPGDCPENHEWSDVHQTCVPMGVELPNPKDTETFMKNWYEKRPEILTDPEYLKAVTDPKYPNEVQKHVDLINTVIPQMQNQFIPNEGGSELPPIVYKDELGDPSAVGQYVKAADGNPAQIYVRKDELGKPLDYAATLAHEWTTYLNEPFFNNKKYQQFYSGTIEDNLMSFDDIIDRGIKEGKINPKDDETIAQMEEDYHYSTTPTEDNIHSNINVARQLFNLQPTDVITEERVKQMMEEAVQKGYTDRNNPNYIDDIYRLYRLSKDNKSLANLFNLLASSGEGKNDVSGSDIQMAKYGGNIGKLRKFF
jgi:hypothetical protein